MLTQTMEAGQKIAVLYPTHGKLNVLRNVVGTIDKIGTGPNGPNVTVVEDNGNIRCLSKKKIVETL